MTVLRILGMGLTLICVPASLFAAQPQPLSDNYLLLPQQAEKEYMLQMVRETGSKGNQYEEYGRECNSSGICRFTRTETPRQVQYDTPYGMQTVIYP